MNDNYLTPCLALQCKRIMLEHFSRLCVGYSCNTHYSNLSTTVLLLSVEDNFCSLS